MADISKIILPNGDQHTIKDSTARSGLNNKVDKVTGKGLSTNDFTDALETKLNGIEGGAEVNVQADWNVTDSASDAFIKNKPTIPTDTWKAYYGTCTTAAGTRAKEVTVSADQNFSLRVGAIVGVKFSHTNTYSNVTSSPITLNVNSTGAKNIWYNTTHSGAGNTGTSTNAYGYAGRTAYYMYDGTYWVWVSHGVDNNSTYTAASAAPLMDGTAAVGSSAKYAREDHVHPSDTSKVDKVEGKGLSTNDFTDALESKLNGIAAGAEVNVQSDWNETNTSSDAFIKNKPTIPTKTSDLTNDSDFVSDANYVHTDNNFTTTLKDKLDGIASGAEVNVQSDWNATDTSSDAYIKNKPTIPTDTWKAFYGTCSTAAATAEKAITISADQNFALRVGAIIGVKFTVSNTAENVKLNVNSTGAKSIWYNTSVYTGKSTDVCGYANRVYYYLYDGTYWCWVGFGIQPNSNTIPTAYCTTAAGTAAKAASCTNYNLLAKSYTILLISTTNTAASALTLNINGKGAKPIYINGSASSSSNHTMPAGSYLVYYDGTNYYIRTDGKITGDITGDAATVNGKTVGVNVPADAKFTDTVVTKTSELTNDSNFVSDVNYVHTDNNYTSTEKTKLAGVATGAEANVQSDWNVTDTASDAYIKNKPTIPTVPSAATAKPVVDGTAAVGTSAKYAREDHVHPTDTSRAPESHASTATTYGLGDASNYGHVKLSDTYSSKVSNGDAAHGLAASQNALYNAYNNRAPINHAQTASSPLTSTTYGIANETQYGHVMLTDKVTGFYHCQAKYGVAASSYALAELWNGTSTITTFAVYNHELRSKGIYIQRYHNSDLDGMAFIIHKNAWLCMLTGVVEPTQQLAAGEITLWTIPDDCAKFRPQQRVAVICQGSGLNRFLLVIEMDGTIKLDRYGTTGSSGPWPSGCWLNLYACYIACDDGFDWE